MILIINLNMSLDKIYYVNNFDIGKTTRVEEVYNTPGGKGVHVANICYELGEKFKLMGFVGGYTGKFLSEVLDRKYDTKFIKIKGESRTCLNIINNNSGETEFLEIGPCISKDKVDEFIKAYEESLDEAKIVVISGSTPRGIETSFYAKLCKLAKIKNIKVIVDASGELLKESILAKPYAIKPNMDEVAILLENEIDMITDYKPCIRKLKEKGIVLPIISLGKKGAIFGLDEVYLVENPNLLPVNCVGSGDAFIAGLAIGLNRGYSIKDTMKLASACGAANVLEKESGIVSKDMVEHLLKRIMIKKI